MLKSHFAPLILKQNKIKILTNNTQILTTDEELSPFPKFESKYILHRHISTSKNDTKILGSYDDLLRMGFQISKRRASGKYFYHQMIEYFIIKTTSNYPHIGCIPPKHQVAFNFVENYLRLVGRNSSGKKVYMTGKYNKKKQQSNYDIGDYIKIWSEYPILNSPFTYEEQEDRKLIPEIPILKTDDGKIVCLPLTKNNPTIGIFGKKGKGKTLLMHRLADCVYWKWNKRVFIGNDPIPLTHSWSKPWDSDRHQFFISLLSQIGEQSRGLPCVYLTPDTKELGKINFENDIGFKIALSFEDIMENPTSFFEGTKDELGASEKYLKNLIHNDKGEVRSDGLKYCKTLDDIHRIVNEKEWVDVPTDRGIVLRQEIYKIVNEGVRGKIFNLLKELYLSHILDVNTNSSSKWIVDVDGDGYKMYPWDACLFADVVPILITNDLRTNKFFQSYQKFIMSDIFYRQSRDEITKRNNLELWYFLDELQTVTEHNPASKGVFEMINKEARNHRMGIVYTTQDVEDVGRKIWITTDYVVSFQQPSEQAAEIASNYNFFKHQQKDLLKLQKFQAIIAGNELVVYDTEGNRDVVEDGSPFRGMIFPSVSQHSAPKEEGI